MNPISRAANMLEPFKVVRKPGGVKFVWDRRFFIYSFLASQIGTMAFLIYIFLFMMKPIEGYEDFLSTWGIFLLFALVGGLIFMVIMLNIQGAIHVNQTQSKLEIFKGLSLNTRTYFLPFDTLEKIVLTAPSMFASGQTQSQGLLFEQVGIYLKTGEEIELPFARLEPAEALKVVKEIAEAAGIPAFDREGNPIHSLQPLGSRA